MKIDSFIDIALHNLVPFTVQKIGKINQIFMMENLKTNMMFGTMKIQLP